VDCTPSQLQVLVGDGLLEDSAFSTTFLVGGERIDDSLWHHLAGSRTARFYNVYGPTECTVDTAVTRISEQASRPVIGKPISNVKVYVLDRFMQPLPLGVSGELYVGGAGLARGYVHRADQTAECFVPDPWSGISGGRLYRTGDLARWRKDGSLEFLGRIDRQVKVRGYRIELGEIEAALAEHSALQNAAVIVHDRHGEKRLAAYLVARAGAGQPATEELRSSLKQRLPDFMIPASFTFLESLPLNRSGKLDQAALPAPPEPAACPDEDYAAPRTPTEDLLAGIWAEVLRIDRVGVNDNFFELGGHSLLVMQVISRIRSVFGVELPVRRIFLSSELAGLAGDIDTELQSGRRIAAIPFPQAGKYDDSLLDQLEMLADSDLDNLLRGLQSAEPGND
jgi:acyl carrier protein